MSSSAPTREILAFRHSSDIPDDVWVALRENEVAANLILPFAEKARHFPRGPTLDCPYDDTKHVEFVLSCTKGNYPIFIVASKATAQPAHEGKRDEGLASSLEHPVRHLLDEVAAQRVFSVFSIAKVTEIFAKIFVAEAGARQAQGIQARENPY